MYVGTDVEPPVDYGPELPDLQLCDTCDGTGTAPPESGPGLTGQPLTCLACDGAGVITN